MRHFLFLLLLGNLLYGFTLAEDLTDLSDELKSMLENSPVPGLVACAVQDGEITAIGAAGIRKYGDDTAVELDDKFHIGSCTKSMTATLAAHLVEAGELDWDTTVSEIFRKVDVHETYQHTTLQQLLTNTGGTPGDIESGLWRPLMAGKGKLEKQRMQLVTSVLEQPAAYPPGTQEVYSNAGFSIAGAMLETVSRQSYEKLLTTMLFEPLEMESAGFRAPARNGRVNQPYGHLLKAGKAIPVDPEPQGDNPAGIAPAGAVHCSVRDFAKYAMFHLGMDADELISQESRELLHTPTDISNYAMGWITAERDWADGKVLSHGGSNTMFYAVIWIAPEKDFAAIAMCNLGGNEASQICNSAVEFLIRNQLEE